MGEVVEIRVWRGTWGWPWKNVSCGKESGMMSQTPLVAESAAILGLVVAGSCMRYPGSKCACVPESKYE